MRKPDPLSTPSPFTALTRGERERFVVVTSIAAIVVGLGLAIVYAILYIKRPSWPVAIGAAQGLPTLGISLLACRLARRGKAAIGAAILLPYLLVVTAVVSITIGLLPAIAPVYMTFIVVAGTVFGSAGGYGIAVIASILWLLGFFIVGLTLPESTPLEGGSAAIVLVILTEASFILTAFLSQAATSRLWQTLDETAYDLIQANRRLDEANQQKNRFLARMSHDLRTPLTGIILSTGLVRRRLYGDLTEKQDEVLERVLESAERLKLLINDILDISKIEAGQLKLVDGNIQVGFLADTVRNSLAPKASEKGLQFEILVSPTFPQVIRGDETRLIQIMTNLADNAIKFTEAGHVMMRLEAQDNYTWHITVEDTGRGIREADQDLIFEEFHQADEASDAVRGSGLGLAITRHLVHMMKGTIIVRSKLGIGSTFEVTLPLRIPQRT